VKVMTIVGTRPEVIKLSRVMAELDKHVDHVLVHTGQNYDHELNEIFFEQMKLRKPNYNFYCAAAATSTIGVVGNILDFPDRAMEKEKPDAVLLLGDTNSALAAYAAKRRHIPVFHMEAGNRCFDDRVPEEVNRRIVDHISDINMPYTEHARRNLLAEGIPTDRIIKTGSPMPEVLDHYYKQIAASAILEENGLSPGSYIVVSAHREENVDSAVRLVALVDSVNQLAEAYDEPVIFPVHPRTRQQIDKLNLVFDRRVEQLKPLGFFDYIALQKNSRCVVSDSGTLTEEAAHLGFAAVTIRQAHERPEGSDEGTVIMSDLVPNTILNAVGAMQIGVYVPAQTLSYTSTAVSQKVVRTILSYTDYVRRRVYYV
jgi:UDP-N-acetylglucosamine 2-epimerase (non-hydrolysing)